MFEAGLQQLDLDRSQVVHVGDSLASDVGGAKATGIDAAWVNRNHRKLGSGPKPDLVVTKLTELLPLVNSLKLNEHRIPVLTGVKAVHDHNCCQNHRSSRPLVLLTGVEVGYRPQLPSK